MVDVDNSCERWLWEDCKWTNCWKVIKIHMLYFILCVSFCLVSTQVADGGKEKLKMSNRYACGYYFSYDWW